MPLKRANTSANSTIFLRDFKTDATSTTDKTEKDNKKGVRITSDVGGTSSDDSDADYKQMIAGLLKGISYAIWTILAVYCLINYNKKYPKDYARFGYVAFIMLTSSASLGLTEFYSEEVMYSLRLLLEFLELTTALPCFASEVWLKHDTGQKEVAYAHVVVGMIPTYIFLFQHYTRNDLVDFTVIMCVVSLFGVGLRYHNYFSMLAGVAFLVAHCALNHRHEIAREMPSRQIYNYAMASATYFAYRAIT